MYLPEARHEDLTVRELPGETLVYDRRLNKAHCLNRTSALVWRRWCQFHRRIGRSLAPGVSH